MAASFCLLTKTYFGDYDAFARLCDSIDRHMPDVRHYVLVDRSDMALFARFAGPQRILLDCAGLVPGFVEFRLGGRRMWWRRPWFIARGWIYQQLAKLAAVAQLQEDAVILVDSDLVFVRAIRPEQVFDNERTKLYHHPGAPSGPASESDKWHDIASAALGLPQRGYTGSDYISTVIPWSPAVVRDLLAHVERATGRKWHDELVRHFRFSECVLYGVFCDHVPGPHQARLAHTREVLCHLSWGYDLADPAGVDAYVADLGPGKVAALVQSNLGLAGAARDAIYARAALKVQQDDSAA